MTPFETGREDIFLALGLEKIAFAVPHIPPAAVATAGRVGANVGKNIAKEPGSGFWANVRQSAIGRPIEAIKQIGSGKAFTRGGIFAEGFEAPKLWQKGLLYGIPAYLGYNVLKSNDPDKAQQLGGLAASTLAGNALFGPLGMVGGAIAMPLADRMGRGLVNIGQKLTGTFDSNTQNPYHQYMQQHQ
jgi:hypothetical protein